MPDYSKSRIYKLKCPDGHYYIGSTTRPLNIRFSQHKSDSKSFPNRRLYQHINKIGWDKVTMELIEEVSCDNHEALRQLEGEHVNVEDPLCLNDCNAAYNSGVYADFRGQYQKWYRETHKDQKHSHYTRYFATKRNEYYKPKADYSKSYIFKIVNPTTGDCYVDVCGKPPEQYVKTSKKSRPILELWGGRIEILEECSVPNRYDATLWKKKQEWIAKEPNCKNEQFGKSVIRYLGRNHASMK